MDKERKVTRNELYDMIWSKPMIHIASEFGILSTELKNICNKLNVPCPKVGYWSKIAVGKEVHVDPLPEALSNTVLEATISPNDRDIIKRHRDNMKSNTPNILALMTNQDLLSEEPEVSITKKTIPTRIYDNRFKNRGTNTLNISVSKEHMDRAFAIYNLLIKTLRSLGYVFRIENGKSIIEVQNQNVNIMLVEKFKRINIKPSNYSSITTNDIPSGILALKILNFHEERSVRKCYIDGKKTLEKQIPEFIAELPIIADALRKEDLIRAKLWEKWEIEKQHSRRLDLLAEREEKRKTEFNKYFDNWLLSQKVDEFIKIYERDIYNKETDQMKRVQQKKKIAWMKKYFNELNPF